MIPLEIIDKVKKEVSIVAYLQRLGHEPVSTGKQFSYRSPITGERTASFFVDPVRNVWKDFSSDEGGDVIRLVRLLHRFTFPQAVAALQEQAGTLSFFLSGKHSTDLETDTPLEVVAITNIKHAALLEYLNKRRIPATCATIYAKEVHFLSKGKKRFGIGFSTVCGSWAIRSEKFKCWIGKGDYSLIDGPGKGLNVFEGWFDFFSCLVYCQATHLQNPSLILNSTTHLNRALDVIQGAEFVNCFLDNDETGEKATQKIAATGVSVVDQRSIYKGYNDFNAYLMAFL